MRQSIFWPAITAFLDENQDSGGSKTDDSTTTDTSSGQKDGESKGEKDGKDGTEAKDKTFTQADVDRIVTDRLGRAKESMKKDLIAEIKAEAAKDEAKKQGDFEKLYNAEKEAHDTLKADVAKRDHEDLKKRIAAEAKLPEGAWKRLVGETEDELKADAKDMAKTFVSTKDVDTDAGKTRTKSASTADKDIEALKKPDAWGLPTR